MAKPYGLLATAILNMIPFAIRYGEKDSTVLPSFLVLKRLILSYRITSGMGKKIFFINSVTHY
jgi:hypothetical protein